MTCPRSHSDRLRTLVVLDNDLHHLTPAMNPTLCWSLCICDLLHFAEPKCLGSRSAFFPGTTLPPKDKDGKPGGFPCFFSVFLCEEFCQPSANTAYSEVWVWTDEGYSPCTRLQAPRVARPETLQGETGERTVCNPLESSSHAGFATKQLGDLE